MEIPEISISNWQCYNIIKDHKFIWFQYKLLNRILGTRGYLTKLKITEDPYCNFCNYCIEDIIHLFCECHLVQSFWNNLTSWLQKISPINLCLDKERILFGYPEKNKLSFNKNFILIIAKFKCAKEKRQLNNIEFQNFFQKTYNEQIKFSRLCSMFSFCSLFNV